MLNTRSQQANPTVGIIIVAYGHDKELPALLKRLASDKQPGDFIALIDNHPDHACAKIAEKSKAVDTVIRSENIGFAAGCNEATRAIPASVNYLLLLNPDALPEPGAINTLRNQAEPEWDAWMGLLTLPDNTVNSAGNIVHISGLSWCDAYGQPASQFKTKQAVELLSGACLMIRRSVLDQQGGLAESYFMYYEDTDLSVNLWHKGVKLGLVPTARFVHAYEFERGSSKWFYLERNRYIFIIRQWPCSVIAVLSPLLLAVEIGLWLLSITDHRFTTRCKAVASVLTMLPQLLRERRELKEQPRLSGHDFLTHLQPELNSPLLGALGKSRLLNSFLTSYYRLARRLL